MANTKLTWLADLQSFAGVVIGLIMLSIGTVMFLNAGVKLYVLGYESSSYWSAENMCGGDEWRMGAMPIQIKEESPVKKMTPEEKEKCIAKAAVTEKKRYTRDKMEDVINGGIMIFVGFPLWFFHRQRRKNIKKKK